MLKALLHRTLLLFGAIIIAATATAAPLREVRGAWIATSRGLDWPRGESDVERQQNTLLEMLDRLADANFNTVYFEVQGNGDVLWSSMYQPAMADVTGDGRRPMSYDVTRFFIDAAHERGMDAFAIIRPFDLGTFGDAARYSHNCVMHPLYDRLDLVISQNGNQFLDPGNPDTVDYLLNLYSELLSGYNFDGILIDAPLYNSDDFADDDSYSTYNYYGQSRADWRRANLDRFIRELYHLGAELNPTVKLQLALDVRSDTGVKPSYADLIEQGYIDAIVPKLYTRSSRGFTPTLEEWVEGPLAPNTIAAVTPETLTTPPGSEILLSRPVAPDVTEMIDLTRDTGGEMFSAEAATSPAGVVIYRASAITDTRRPDVADTYRRLRDETFRYPAHLPLSRELAYLDIPAPLPPSNVTVTADDLGNYIISWDEAPLDRDGRPAKYYTIYALRGDAQMPVDLSDPRAEIAHRVNGTSYIYPAPLDPGMQFAVTAFDHYNRESMPALSGPKDEGMMTGDDYRFVYYADNLYIRAPKDITSIDIFNIWGNKARHVDTSGNEISISCGDLGGGVYVVHTQFADGSSNVNKFIK